MKNKKTLTAIIRFLLLMILAVSTTACGKKEERPVLKMATEATFPPYEYYANGKICGIDVDIVSTIADRLGYDVQVIDMKFDAVITAVRTAKADIAASGITVTADRKKMIDFTLPYVQAYQLIIVPVNSPIKGKNDLLTTNPILASEWNCEKNDALTPMDVLPNSNKKVWWKCSYGHSWEARIADRNKGTGCPICRRSPKR